MDSHTLIQALIYLGSAALIVPIAVRLGLGSVLGYLIAGCIIGPWGLRLVTDAEAILHFAEIGVVLMLYSGAGISAISSVPYAFSEVLPKLTLGTWTYIFQGLLVLTLMIMRRKFVPSYLFSFVVGFVFGELLDFYEWWIHLLPYNVPMRIVYFVVSYLVICCLLYTSDAADD